MSCTSYNHARAKLQPLAFTTIMYGELDGDQEPQWVMLGPLPTGGPRFLLEPPGLFS